MLNKDFKQIATATSSTVDVDAESWEEYVQTVTTAFHLFMFFCRSEKGLLNYESERIKLVYRINSTRCSFQKK